MELSLYKKQALRSETPLLEVRGDVEMITQALELAVAAADLIDYIKKVVVYGKAVDYAKLAKFAGSVRAWAACVEHTGDCGEPGPDFVNIVAMNPRLFHAAVGAFGEAGEKLSALLQQQTTGRLDLDNVVEEAGDSLWYSAVELDEIERLTGTTPAAVARKNIRKLEIRFPEKFTLDASEARSYEAEAAAMKTVGN